MNRFPLLPLCLGALFLAGCEAPQPPSAEQLRRVAARTASGTVNTKLEARVQPPVPKAGSFSFWDLKVFDMKDKEDGTRQEWAFFNDLPQSASDATISEVLMNAWVVSRSGQVFLPSHPKYQAYGSFNTDWTIPRAGKYTFYAEYQPSKVGEIFPTETARWNFTVAPGPSPQKRVRDEPNWSPTHNPIPITVGGAPDGEPAGTLSIENLPSSVGESKSATIKGVPQGAAELQLAAMTAGGEFFHFARNSDGSYPVSFKTAGMVRFWAYFTLNGVPYAAPLNQLIS